MSQPQQESYPEVRAGFLKDLFEPWLEVLPSDEWGEYVGALWGLGDAALAMNDEQALMVLRWLRDELARALVARELSMDELPGIETARDHYAAALADWRGRIDPEEAAALEAEAAAAPAVLRPLGSIPEPNGA